MLRFMLYFSTDFLAGKFTAISRAVARVRGMGYSRFKQPVGSDAAVANSEPRRLTLVEQWNLLSDIIKGAFVSAEEATRCHKSAALQLDLAQYALISLVGELSAVMDVGGRRRAATVHVLDVQPPPAPLRPFDDAIAA
jgi:hypothetical protein